MKHIFKGIFTLLALTLLTSISAQAGEHEKMVIQLKTNDFELAETDISTLAVGESQTIETDSGKIIDLLRTVDGVEIYIDGELLDMNFDQTGLHVRHAIRKHVEIICDDNHECDENVFVFAGDGDFDAEALVDADGTHFVIHQNIELSCSDNDEESGCSDQMVWISADDDFDLEALHELHIDGTDEYHKVIIIKKSVVTEN